MKAGRGYGKILLVGGYTVLEHPNRSLILSVKNAFIDVRAKEHNRWVISSDYGRWEGMDPSALERPFHFVREAILSSGVREPHYISISSSIHFRPGKKLGLGSSAAVTTAIVKALNNRLTEDQLFRRAYRAHVLAQGKIGSGFDVAASVFGSIIYTRPYDEYGNGYKVKKVRVPKELYMAMYNIKGAGTDTSISASKVMKTVRENPEARTVFDSLANSNEAAIDYFMNHDLEGFLDKLREINELRRRLGLLSKVPIEPPELDSIRKKIEEKEFVTVLPGAGGYDSMLVVGDRYIPHFNYSGLEEVKIWLR